LNYAVVGNTKLGMARSKITEYGWIGESVDAAAGINDARCIHPAVRRRRSTGSRI
jgi:hypothetical protein